MLYDVFTFQWAVVRNTFVHARAYVSFCTKNLALDVANDLNNQLGMHDKLCNLIRGAAGGSC